MGWLIAWGMLLLILLLPAQRRTVRRSAGRGSSKRPRVRSRPIEDRVSSGRDRSSTTRLSAAVALLAVTGVVLLICGSLLFSHIIPPHLVRESLAVASWDLETWESRLEPHAELHDKWLREIGYSKETRDEIQTALWDYWPVIPVLGIGIAALGATAAGGRVRRAGQ